MLRLLKFSIFLCFLVAPCAFAQSIFDPAAPAQANPPSSSSSLSSSDYIKKVKELSQQTNSGLNQEAKQLLPKPPTSSPGSQTAGAASGNQPTAPAQVNDSFSVNAGSKPTSPQPGAAPTQPSDTYTGFGGGSRNTGKTTAPASSGSSGGWNINY